MAITPPATLARPFAESGDKANIPDTTSTAGVASLSEGFPPVTQLPLSAGGIPPRRLDFNGVLNIPPFAFGSILEANCLNTGRGIPSGTLKSRTGN